MSGIRSSSQGFTRGFYSLVAVRFFGSFAVQLQAVILGWQMYRFTGEPLDLGLVGLAEAIPAISLALFAGYFVDRINPKKIITGVILLSLTSMLLAWKATTPTELFIAAFLTGIARSFYSPSFQALLPRLVPKAIINKAIAAGTSAMKLAYVTGPAAGGLLVGWYGERTGYGVGIAFLLLAVGALFTMHYDHRPYIKTVRVEKSFLTELFAGLNYVLRHRLLFSVLSLDMFAVLFGGVTAMLPVVAADVLKVGPEGLGFLRASPAIGALAMSLWLVRNPVNRGAGRYLLQVVAGWGVCIIAFAISRELILSCGILILSGALDSVSMVIRGSIVQLSSPEAMRGRIAAVNSIFIGSSNELGAFESGVAARFFGLIPSFYFGGIMTLLVVGLIAKGVPELMKVDLDSLTAD
jgi:MFS family permease